MVKIKLFSLAFKGLSVISVSQPPLYIPNAPVELQCCEMALLDVLQTLLHLWVFALMGRKLWDITLVRVLFRACAHAQKVACYTHCSASSLFHLMYSRDLSMLAHREGLPSFYCSLHSIA